VLEPKRFHTRYARWGDEEPMGLQKVLLATELAVEMGLEM
jgi:hypothetical protein